jgi:ubiquitin carboxyl-terminal hydrolase 8
MDAENLENAMVIAPRTETSVFQNRDKFDLVAVYDQSSTTFGDPTTPLSILVGIISERAFKKMLKRMPMMLVGGLDAWKQEFGTAELIRDPSAAPDVPKPYSPPTSPNPNNPFTNGMLNSLVTGNSNGSDPHQVWTPRPRPGLPLNGSFMNEHRPTNSLDISQHSR